MTLFCFGDSNTYGYDPRSLYGDRFPPEIRWTGLLAQATGWKILEAGQNGREIPRRPGELDALRRLPQTDAMTIMLGSNDLLLRPYLSAEDVALRMEGCLRVLQAAFPDTRLLLVAPPPMAKGTWVTEPRLVRESARLGSCYQALAERLGTDFADSGTWNIDTLFDGVHFSELGHRAFARGIQAALEK